MAGAVYETASHPGVTPAGLALVERLAPMDLPVIAIGGVTIERVPEVCGAGAAGVAVIRAAWSTPDPVAAAGDLCDALEAAGRG
jgi:thiamine monophosphate synthase